MSRIIKIKITLAFEKINNNPTFYEKLISWWTKSDIIHSEIIIDNKWVSAVIGKGIRILPLGPLRDNYLYKDIEINISEEEYDLVLKWIDEQKGKKYDILGIILSQVFPFRIHAKNKWFCSEITVKVLQLLNEKRVKDKKPHVISPGDLANIYNV